MVLNHQVEDCAQPGVNIDRQHWVHNVLHGQFFIDTVIQVRQQVHLVEMQASPRLLKFGANAF
jgi:hypothetical protein